MDTASRMPPRMQAFILAGGQGQRLFPLTRDRAKPAVPFGGGHRLIDFTLSNCINSGIRRIRILTQYQCDSLHSYIQALTPQMGGKSDASEVLCQCPVSGKRYRGTADAVFQNLAVIESSDAEPVLILSGDHVYRMDYRDLVRSHVASGAAVTVAALEWPLEAAGQFGVLETDSHGHMTRFQEKPGTLQTIAKRSFSALINMGVYVFDKRTLIDALTSDARQTTSHDFGSDIIPALVQKKLVSVFNFTKASTRLGSYWRDVGTLDAFYRASMDLLVTNFLDPYQSAVWPICGLEASHNSGNLSSELRAGTAVDSIVSHDVAIGPGSRVVHSILSPGVQIGRDVEIRNSVVLSNVCIGDGARIDRAILDEKAIITAGTKIGESGIVVIPRDSDVEPFHVNASWTTKLIAGDRPRRTPSFS